VSSDQLITVLITLFQGQSYIKVCECLTIRGPCILIYSYNKSQKVALFLNIILIKNSTCFGKIYCPSWGVLILYSHQ